MLSIRTIATDIHRCDGEAGVSAGGYGQGVAVGRLQRRRLAGHVCRHMFNTDAEHLLITPRLYALTSRHVLRSPLC